MLAGALAYIYVLSQTYILYYLIFLLSRFSCRIIVIYGYFRAGTIGCFAPSITHGNWRHVSRRINFHSARRRNEAMRWHRRLTTTQQMKNQANDMAGYLFFTVLSNRGSDVLFLRSLANSLRSNSARTAVHRCSPVPSACNNLFARSTGNTGCHTPSQTQETQTVENIQ